MNTKNVMEKNFIGKNSIGLHDAEKGYFKRVKRFPNLALMKIAAWHKAKGDTVIWWLPKAQHDRVYSSKIFDFTANNLFLPEDTIRGGTGYSDIALSQKLPQEMDDIFPDYTIYPECNYAIGYLTRGCPNHCRWCVVPEKEGAIRPYRQWDEIVRPDTNQLVLMDNNILASDHGIMQLEKLIGSGYHIDLNQGMDARLISKDIALILSRLNWIRFLRFSCDSKSQIEPVCHAIELLGKYGVRPYRIFIYMLVTSDIEDAAERVEVLRGYKAINLYAQAERNGRLGIIPNKAQLEFAQRYVYSGKYRKETWWEYCKRKNFSDY